MSARCAALLAGAALCHAAAAGDLATIYREALQNNAQYQAAEAQFAAVRERVPQSVASFLPAVSVSANTIWNDNNSNTLGRQQYNSDGYTVTLVQPVWRPQNTIALREARSQVEQAKAQLELAQQELLVHTAQAYFDVLYAEDALNTFREQRAADLQLLEQAGRNFKVGAAPITDVRDAESRYALVLAQEIAASNEVAAKTQALRHIINNDPGPLQRLRSGVALTRPVPDSMPPWERAAEASNAAVIAAQAALEAARTEADRVKAARAPTLDLVASHGVSKSATNITVGQDLHADTVGLQFSVPIYSGGGTSAKVRENIALVNKASAELEDAKRNSVLAAEQSYLGATSGLAQVQALENAFIAAQAALDSNKRGFEVGNRINIDVLNAQQELAKTTRDLAKARYDTLMSFLRLKAAAGSLGTADIDDVNALLEK